MPTMAAFLVLEDGTLFSGLSFGARKPISGEVVFQTGLVGYPQSMTDPSYHRQILVLTYPLIGNYGVPDPERRDEFGLPKFVESEKIWVAGLIVAENVDQYSHWNAKFSFSDWMKSENVPGIEGIDTRHLTQLIRDKGSILGAIFYEENFKPTSFTNPNVLNLVQEVSVKTERQFNVNPKLPHVAVIDVGVKTSQIACLIEEGMQVTVLPWNYNILEHLRKFSGIFISNGPGDPSMVQKLVDNLKTLMQSGSEIPIFGICLGHQLLARAAGLKTYKMKYGNRGHNQPCRFMKTEQCFVTSQNHGFAVDDSQLPPDWLTLFTNQNDESNEGIVHSSKPYFSVQFHPEHCAGPEDARFLFKVFASKVKNFHQNSKSSQSSIIDDIANHLCVPNLIIPTKPKKVLILGSGGLSIGQAGEFDYSGSQAIKALREENIQIVLINPNIATVQTNPGFAHKVYFDPITFEYVVEVIEIERPDGILLMFGGQTALNCGIELEKGGIFKKFNVKVLGTPITSIIESEDRELFAKVVADVGAEVVISQAAKTEQEAIVVASKIGYPILVRAIYTLGGLGSGFASNETELKALVSKCFVHSPQVFLDKSLRGWKEVEYEVVRDVYDNCVTVCNMENMDPLGVHTGESIVVAPSQTLTDSEYQKLRTTAIKIVRRLGVVGECNVQYALDPNSEQFYVIEVNARLSRSSALASKATGYPLAYVAAKLALGYSLTLIKNSMTQKTACFEPSLDYCVVKMPRWDLNKFTGVSRKIGSSMKSVGEVMAIGRKFEEAFQKAIRMVDENYLGFEPTDQHVNDKDISIPTDERVFTLAAALNQGYTVEKLNDLTKIDCWFLHKLKNISKFTEEKLKVIDSVPSDPSKIDKNIIQLILDAKKLGFCDKQIARYVKSTETYIRSIRHKNNIHPFVKQVDTVSGEWPAFTNYLYTTYNANEHDVKFGNESTAVMVLGSGVYRIGCSVEFDCCAVGCVQELRKLKRPTILINYNPETVSTDYDMCERLYFDELSFEVVMDIYELENPAGVILSMGGQLPNNIAKDLNQMKVRIIGTSAECIDGAENRFKFSRTLDNKKIAQPEWKELTDIKQAKEFCARVGYPCIVRPSYVLSGAAMNVATSPDDLELYLNQAKTVSKENPVVISKFVMDAKEIDVDAVAKNGVLVSMAVSEHVENAGVHSGDATLVTPPQDLNSETLSRIKNICALIGKELSVNGPYNLQLIAKDNELKVIECNLRVSRSFPFVSKTLGYDFVAAATRAMMDQEVEPMMICPTPKNDFTSTSGVCRPRVGVKVAQFSFSRLAGADFMLGVEMASTGEVACFGVNRQQAYLKALLSTGFRMPKKNILLSIGTYRHKVELETSVRNLHDLGYKLFGSKGTSDFYNTQFKANIVHSIEWPFENLSGGDGTIQSIAEFLIEKKLDLVINLPMTSGGARRVSTHGYRTRRFAVDNAVPLIADVKCAKLFVQALTDLKIRAGLENWKRKLPILTNIDCLSSQNILRFPGFIDVHVHFRDPGQTHKEDFETGSAAALSGGITAVCVMPNTTPNITNIEALQQIRIAAAKKCRIDYAIYMMASATNANDWINLPAEKLPIALKMYLDTTFVDNPLKNMRVWKEHFENWPKRLPICVHAEGLTMAAVLLFANMYNRPVHVCHVSREEEILIIKKAKEERIQVTCEVTPHHLFLCQDDAPAIGEGWSEVRPVLATKKDQEALWANLDTVDIFASDHAPHTKEEKESQSPPPGFPGVDTMLPLLLNAVHEGRLTEKDIIEKMYLNPKRIFNLPDQPDTYVEVDMDETWTIGQNYFSKSNWSPFEGKKVRGRVRRVVVRDKLAFVDGQVLLPPNFGREMYPAGDLGARSGSFIDHSSEHRDHSLPSSPRKGELVSELQIEIPKIEKSIFTNGSSFVSELEELRGTNILTVTTFRRDVLHPLFNLAQKYKQKVQQNNCKDLQRVLKDKLVGLLFFENSTRTYCSFTAAVERLGARIVPFPIETSSMKKGESLNDTVSTIAQYVNSLIIRHPEPGAVMKVASIPAVKGKPVINAGDGTGEHPTQALLDVFTIREEIGTVNGLIVTMVGDLKNGRTVHSLAKLLSVYELAELRYVALPGLEMPQEVIDYVTEKTKGKILQTFPKSLKEAVVDTDVLYMTRVQKERGTTNGIVDLYQSLRVTPELMTLARKPKMIVMHPLPRNDEISPEFDVDPRAVYLKQMENGVYVRMALLTALLTK